ncbi:hypothetical protein LTR37_007509 [Vermiconidia calcicola]|uniref:Uncharacterized protein n=1 Tax=Vermiconidia calcicola TaxID=1690605 RepID=A0ACC3NE64_9PEZI|nr:hypothetical protein LTR37_007509 [Vermiconidia calcicola]
MDRISTIRDSNAQCKCLDGLVAVFVGGTGGIGESTATEFFMRTTRPRAYIVGRNEEKGLRLVKFLQELNLEGQAFFIQKDISLLREVDELCEELKQRESKIHCLFLSAGYMTLKGRMETVEGIDRKMCVNYYGRAKCTLNLMPLLQAASAANEVSRVITVLAAGSEGEVRLDDLDLKHNFTLHACLAHCVVMTDFMIEELSRRYPSTAFSHSYPGTVKTGIANQLSGPVRLAVKVMYSVMSPWILNVQESGERHFFQMTSQCYPSSNGGVGIPPPDDMTAFKSMDGTPGGGSYLLDWDGTTTGDENVLAKYRKIDMGPKVWEHTTQIFEEAQRRMRKDTKRRASEEAEGDNRSIPNPIGWRPA